MICVIGTREELEDVIQQDAGFLYNDFGGRDPKMCPIHQVGCSWIRTMLNMALGPLSVKKTWSDSLSELLGWIANEGKVFRFCGSESRLAALAEEGPGYRTPGTVVACGHAVERATGPHPVPPRTGSLSPDAVTFHVRLTNSRSGPVEFWSETRLQFDSRPLTKSMKGAISVAIQNLLPSQGQILAGIYTSDVRGIVDTENVLFYNVGAGSFSRPAQHGIRFERCHDACPTCPTNIRSRHYHRYELIAPDGPFHHWRKGPVLATWDTVPSPAIGEFTTPEGIWLAMKRSRVECTVSRAPLWIARTKPGRSLDGRVDGCLGSATAVVASR